MRKTNGKIQEMSVLDILDIGREKAPTENYLESVKLHFGLQYHPEVMEMIDLSSHGKIHLLLGCDLSQTFHYPIRTQI